MAGKFSVNTMKLTAAAKALDDAIDAEAGQAASEPLFLAVEDASVNARTESTPTDSDNPSSIAILRDSEIARKRDTIQSRESEGDQPNTRALVMERKQGRMPETKHEQLRTMLRTKMVALNTRVPEAMREWIDEHVAERRREKVTIQDITLEAYTDYILKHGVEQGTK